MTKAAFGKMEYQGRTGPGFYSVETNTKAHYLISTSHEDAAPILKALADDISEAMTE